MNQGKSSIALKAFGTAMMAVLLAVACAVALGLTSPSQAHALKAGQTFKEGQTFTVGGNKYKITDYDAFEAEMGEVMLVKYGSTNKKPTINTVKYKGETFEVETIGAGAFNNAKGHRITSITLGKHVDEVRTKAFYGCSKLKSINMAKADLIELKRVGKNYKPVDVDLGKNVFKKAGTPKIQVKCGSNNAKYKQAFKKVLISKGMRKSVRVVK